MAGSGWGLVLDPTSEDATNAQLDINDGTSYRALSPLGFDPPELDPQFLSSVDSEGDPLSSLRYKNRQIQIPLRVYGSTPAGLATNLVALHKKLGKLNREGGTLKVTVPAQSYRDTILAAGPSLYWRHGESAGTTATDTSGNGRTGTYSGGITLGVAGALAGDSDTAVDLDGVNGVVTSSYNPFTNATTRTYEGWAKRDTQTTFDTLFGGRQVANTNAYVRLASGSGDVQFTPDAAAANPSVTWTGAWPGTAQWVHWVLVFNESTDTAELYINGASQGTKVVTQVYNASPGVFAIGDYQSGANLPFDGKVDETAVYERGLSAAEILQHYNVGIATSLAVVFDLLTANATEPIDQSFGASSRTMIGLNFDAKPFGRGTERSYTLRSETALPVLTATETGVLGDAPGLGRLEIIEAQGQDQWNVVWGIQSRYYDASADAALFYEAEGRTVQGGAATSAAVDATASGSTPKAVLQGSLTTTYQSMLSTQATGGGNHLKHIGTFRVFARFQRPATNSGAVSVALDWGEGDLRKRNTNDAVSYAVDEREGVWTIADLGLVRLSKVVAGTQRWEGRFLGKSTVAGDDIYLDCFWLFPVDEGYGEISAVFQLENPTSFSARDEFDQTAGNLTGGKTTNDVSAITVANPGVLTVTTHGLANGNTVWIEGITGTMGAVLNGYRTVANVAANTFDVGVNTTGLTYISGGTVSKIGKTLPQGGGWYLGDTGTATDFSIDTAGHTAQRAAVSDGAHQIAIAPAPGALAATVVRADVKFSALPGTELARFGVVARYASISPTGNYIRAVIQGAGVAGKFKFAVDASSGGTSVVSAGSSVLNLAVGITYTVQLYIDAAGRWRADLVQSGASTPVASLSGLDSSLATGGALASGRVGLWDIQPGSTAITRNYDNFVAFVPVSSLDAALFASRNVEVRNDRIVRQDSGGTLWTAPSSYKGDYLLVPPAGREARSIRFMVKAMRGDPDTMSDPAIDDLSARLNYKPRFLTVPDV